MGRQGLDRGLILHVNPSLPEKGLAVVYDPSGEPLEQDVTLPLYYSGLETVARVSHEGGPPRPYTLDREYRITLRARVAPHSRTRFVIR